MCGSSRLRSAPLSRKAAKAAKAVEAAEPLPSIRGRRWPREDRPSLMQMPAMVSAGPIGADPLNGSGPIMRAAHAGPPVLPTTIESALPGRIDFSSRHAVTFLLPSWLCWPALKRCPDRCGVRSVSQHALPWPSSTFTVRLPHPVRLWRAADEENRWKPCGVLAAGW